MTYDPDKLRLERELAKPGTYGGVTDQMPFGIRVGHVVNGLVGGNEYRYQHDAEYHAWATDNGCPYWSECFDNRENNQPILSEAP